MAKLLFANNAATTLAADAAIGATQLTLTSATAFPTPSNSNYYYVTLDDGTNIEVVKVTGKSSSILVVTRAQEGTSARAWSTGAKVELRETAATLNQFVQNEGVVASSSMLLRIPGATTASNTVGTDAIGIGSNPTPSGQTSIAIGGGVTASGQNSIAIGSGTTSTAGVQGISIGKNIDNQVTGTGGVAIGNTLTVNGGYGIAIGNTCTAGVSAVAIGTATAVQEGVAVGAYSDADTTGVAIGRSAATGEAGCTSVGAYAKTPDVPGSVAVGFNARVKKTLPVWQASTAYYSGDFITNTAGTKVFMLTNISTSVPEETFTSGGSEPTWATDRFTETTDGATCTWLYVYDVPAPMYALTDAAMAIGRRAEVYVTGVSIGDSAKATNGIAIAGRALCDASVALYGQAKMDRGIAIGADSAVYASTYSSDNEGNIAIGAKSKALGNQYSVAIGTWASNNLADSHTIGGCSVVPKAIGNGAYNQNHLWDSAQENYILSDDIDMKQTAADDIVTFVVPTGSKFFPTEFGFIVTAANTVSVNPQVSFGITGNTTSLVAQSAMDKTSAGGRKVFTPQANSGDGVATAIKASLKVAATATTLSGRFYVKGLLVEDQ